MSFRVLVVPEDPIYNGFILQPLVERVIREAGKTSPKVTVLTNPKLSGFEHAKKNLSAICERYKHFDLVLFLPDRDGKPGRDDSLRELSSSLGKKYPFYAIAAVEEVETWLLAGHKSKLAREWRYVREDPDVKENDFKGFIQIHGDDGPGQGRERLMKETLNNFRGLRSSCPEIDLLVKTISAMLMPS